MLTDKTKHLVAVRKITKLLESKFSIWKFKFGIDPLLGLLPGLGDILDFVMASSEDDISAFNSSTGLTPVVFLNSVIKPNTKNLAILEKEIKNLS